MDKGSIFGSLLMTVCCAVVFWKATHGHLEALWSDKGAIMVIGGTAAVIFMAMPMDKIKCVPGYLKKFLFFKGQSPLDIVAQMNALAEKARREGILSLEPDVAKLKDPFLMSGLKQAIDGVAPEAIEATMRLEVMAMTERHKAGKKFFDLIKVYGPGIALTATLIGQVGMFSSLGGAIEVMGHMLAVAVVATMYGTVIANCIAGPMGDRLALRSSEEILTREMVIQGILSVQAGDNPRVTTDRMLAFVPGPQRSKLKLAA
ncbi:motility protein A [soil metagenome]